MLTASVKAYMNYIENCFPVRFWYITPDMGYYSYADMAEYLCKKGCRGIINVSTDNLPEIMEICERNRVYLIQLWDITGDTDILEHLFSNQYFLGILQNDDEGASFLMAETLAAAGCKSALILNYSYMMQNTQAHNIRSRYFFRGFKTAGTVKELKVSDYKKTLIFLSSEGIRYDALVFTRAYSGMTLDEIKKLPGNGRMKFVYFNADENTRSDLQEKNAVLVACGQQNVFGLAFACVFSAIQGYPVRGIHISCPYLYLESEKDYDLYRQWCVDRMPYDADDLKTIIKKLPGQSEIITEYARKYSVQWLEEKTEGKNRRK
jgi:hypothetical protein